jgi:ABC-type Fe3+ transport system substrate-binding protein
MIRGRGGASASAGSRASARALLLAALALAAPAWAQEGAEAVATFGVDGAQQQLLVRGATDIAFIAPALEAFVERWPEIRVTIEAWNSNELYQAATAACRGEAPAADLLISSSADQQVKLVNDGCAAPHRSAATAGLPPEANWRDEIFGVTREPAVIVYNRALVPLDQAPRSRFDLLDLLRRHPERYAGRVATYDIEESGVGYLFAFVDSQQATTFGSLLEAFGRIGAVATCCTVEIVDGVASGKYLIAYNMLGSYALARAAEDPDLAVVAPDDYTLVLSRAALIPKGAGNPAAAGVLIDFLLSDEGRRAMASTHLTVDVAGPDGLGSGETVLRPIALSPVLLLGLDNHRRSQLIDAWRATFAGP